MSDLSQFRDHCAAMAGAIHKPECFWRPNPWVKARPTEGCAGCLSDADRSLFGQMAAEVDDYRAPQPDLFGALTDEPTPPEPATQEEA